MLKYIFLLFPLFAHAQFANTAFYQVRTKQLAFSTTAQTVYQGNCSGIVTIQSRNGSGGAQNVSLPTPITLNATGTTSYFSDSYCRNSISTFTIPNGQNSVSFYFVTSDIGTNTFTASATGYKSGSQSETIPVNPYVWIGLGGDANWATGANWQGGVAPGNTQVAVFNNTCVSNCSPTIASTITIKGIRMESGYAGTITQGSGAIMNIGAMGMLQYGGNFVGANADIILSGSPLIVNAGTFTSTSGALKFADAKGGYSRWDTLVVTNSNSFFHNNGLVWFHLRSSNDPVHDVKLAANNPLYDVRVRDDTGTTDDVELSSSLSPSRPVIQGTMTLANNGLHGQWELQGNLVFGANFESYLGPGSAAFTFSGSADQTIDNTIGIGVPTGNITISKSATSKITLLSNYTLTPTAQTVTFTSGRIDVGSSTFTIPGNTLTMASGTEVYLNTGVLKVNGTNRTAGPYGSGTIISGAAP